MVGRLDLLTVKISTYEKFNQAYPAYGGYFPWITVADSGIVPTPDWLQPARVPGVSQRVFDSCVFSVSRFSCTALIMYSCVSAVQLDNGELIWALVATVSVLQSVGQPSLAARYQAQLDLMAKFGTTVFHDGQGRIRAVAGIYNLQIGRCTDRMHECGSPHLVPASARVIDSQRPSPAITTRWSRAATAAIWTTLTKESSSPCSSTSTGSGTTRRTGTYSGHTRSSAEWCAPLLCVAVHMLILIRNACALPLRAAAIC